MDTSSDGGTDSLQECDERPRIVRDELPAVTRGSFPSLDYVHCQSKCEAVVEGMGGIVSLHGDKSRGRLRQELTEIEALVHYNFPPLASRACEVLIEEVLNHYFTGPDGKQRPWHFEHATADQGRRALFARRSKVMRRHDEAEVKHAFLGCDV